MIIKPNKSQWKFDRSQLAFGVFQRSIQSTLRKIILRILLGKVNFAFIIPNRSYKIVLIKSSMQCSSVQVSSLFPSLPISLKQKKHKSLHFNILVFQCISTDISENQLSIYSITYKTTLLEFLYCFLTPNTCL